MRGIFGALTLAMIGVIIADLAIHPQAMTAGGTQLNQALATMFSSMLGTSPYAKASG